MALSIHPKSGAGKFKVAHEFEPGAHEVCALYEGLYDLALSEILTLALPRPPRPHLRP